MAAPHEFHRRSHLGLLGLPLALLLSLPSCAGSEGATGEPGAGTSSSGSGAASGSSSSSGGAATSGSSGSGPADAGPGPQGPLTPPARAASLGTGGVAGQAGVVRQAGGISYRINTPSSYVAATPTPLLLVFSGTEGGATMARNLGSVGPATGTAGFVEAVLDGVQYRGNGAAGATVLDDVRALYNIDNDRCYLLGESAGTSAALSLGLRLRQSYFAAYWANDVNDRLTPAMDARALGFAPFGQAGPGGDLANAQAIVQGMRAAGYRLDPVAPYAGPGAGTHGAPDQFMAALRWFANKTRI